MMLSCANARSVAWSVFHSDNGRHDRQAISDPTIASVDCGLGRRRPCEVDPKLSDAIVRGHVASNDQGEQQLFSSVRVEADRQRQQLSGVLRNLGATPVTPVTVLSDGAEGPWLLGESASPSPTHHVLDWFHLSMRVQHVTQTARSWPRATKEDLQQGDVLSKKIEQIRWRLWHGRPQGALDLIDEILQDLNTLKRQIQLTAA